MTDVQTVAVRGSWSDRQDHSAWAEQVAHVLRIGCGVRIASLSNPGRNAGVDGRRTIDRSSQCSCGTRATLVQRLDDARLEQSRQQRVLRVSPPDLGDHDRRDRRDHTTGERGGEELVHPGFAASAERPIGARTPVW